MKTFYIETLGCPKNRVDSEIMLAGLLEKDFEYESNPEKASIIIVNTCGFLTSAVNESIERIVSLSENKETGRCEILVVAGCLVERYKNGLLEEIPEIDGLLGTSNYLKIYDSIIRLLQSGKKQKIGLEKPIYSTVNFDAEREITTKIYSYLKIAEGCSNGCSFCNIPKLRGKQVSRGLHSIKADFKRLLEHGIKEINLISQDCSSYGYDLNKEDRLAPLIRSLLETNDDEFWIRVLYSYPNRYPVELFEIMKNDSRMVPYADLPFQHISDKVLEDMNRKIKRVQLEKLIEKAMEQNEQIALRTTFIVGFPTETEKDFSELLDFVEKGYFEHVGVFTYSHEDNIKSNTLGDLIPEKEKTERRKLLMEAQQAVSLEKNRARIGQIQKVLVEGEYEETELLLKGRNKYQGVDIDGVVLINEGKAEIGQFEKVRITEAHPYDLVGGVVNDNCKMD
jgi:ribosomal protein S12 methylthiotransferase